MKGILAAALFVFTGACYVDNQLSPSSSETDPPHSPPSRVSHYAGSWYEAQANDWSVSRDWRDLDRVKVNFDNHGKPSATVWLSSGENITLKNFSWKDAKWSAEWNGAEWKNNLAAADSWDASAGWSIAITPPANEGGSVKIGVIATESDGTKLTAAADVWATEWND